MRFLPHTLIASGLFGSLLLSGCNETTRNDVTAARDRVKQEERRLEDIKHEEGRAIKAEKREAAEARTTYKPVVGDDLNEGSREEAREVDRAKSAAEERLNQQKERIDNAKRDAADKEARLVHQQDRDKFLIDCKAAIDLSNRAIEKLQAEKNAADEAGKASLDEKINSIKSKRDALQTKINDIRNADVRRWSDHRAAAQKAMDELSQASGSVS